MKVISFYKTPFLWIKAILSSMKMAAKKHTAPAAYIPQYLQIC